MTTTILNTKISEVENKIPHASSLVTATFLNKKISEVENEILDQTKYITTEEFNKLTAENFTSRSKQANLLSKSDFDNKLISFNRKITSNKTKYLEFHKMLNTLIRKDDNIFSGRINFTSNDGPQNLFVYQPIFLNQHFLSTHLFINT